LLFGEARDRVRRNRRLLVDHPLPWLRYVDADRVSASDLSFDGMKVRNDAMETLGKVQVFILDYI
jgi:hypothetical protein